MYSLTAITSEKQNSHISQAILKFLSREDKNQKHHNEILTSRTFVRARGGQYAPANRGCNANFGILFAYFIPKNAS